MKTTLPKKWSRRVLSMYIIVTVLGSVVLVLLLVLLGLLYWMTSPVALPGPSTFVTTESPSAIVIRAEQIDELPQPILDGITQGLPSQAQRVLLSKGTSRVSIVGSSVGNEGDYVAISLSHSPGRFWLVRRDLERRVEKSLMPYSLTYSGEEAIFTPDTDAASPIFSLVECSLIRGSRREAITDAIALLKAPEGRSELRLNIGKSGFAGWSSAGSASLPVQHIFSPTLLLRWEEAVRRIAQDFPEATGGRFDFWGDFLSRNRVQVHVTFQSSNVDGIQTWLTGNSEALGIGGATVTAFENKVQLDFTLDF